MTKSTYGLRFREVPSLGRAWSAINGRGAGEDFSGPSHVPSQGNNPNIALTRPQVIGPLTLVGQ